ncbi:MAG: hypothetical protein CMD83_16130 [Gammaproteobacteria bacterium]|nr:hypothetical protein [Gammaproteobacteria bacterium]MBS02590.1 hypothetical protein [Gammaproteobacteria bacterium]|tara:strand:+ start:430 stop:783 length:354 start_codon:yes stop_codon:yes gene_type:complete
MSRKVDAGRTIGGVAVHGRAVDPETRCAHWHSPLDIIAIRFACCERWYPCNDCHAELADHPPRVWPHTAFDERAVLCGACGHQLTVNEYLGCDSTCTRCGASFNPGCALHYHLYFAR